MKKVKLDFSIPKYVLEEIEEYIASFNDENQKYVKLDNINVLINLAVMNNRITKKQANELKEFLKINKKGDI